MLKGSVSNKSADIILENNTKLSLFSILTIIKRYNMMYLREDDVI